MTQNTVHMYTIGYGNRAPEELVSVLKANDIKLVIDIRRECKARILEYMPPDTRDTVHMIPTLHE